jgi:hypothetical protein
VRFTHAFLKICGGSVGETVEKHNQVVCFHGHAIISQHICRNWQKNQVELL